MVLADKKTTTIRASAWPIMKPIMLFSWSGKPYRSPQVIVCPIVVTAVERLDVQKSVLGMGYWRPGTDEYREGLWKSEGFYSQNEMDAWFMDSLKKFATYPMWMMTFRKMTCADNDLLFSKP